MDDTSTPRPASALETAAFAGIWPDLFDGDLPPLAPGRRFEVSATAPGDDTPLMLADASQESVAEVFAMVLGHCSEMTDFEVRVRPLG